MKSYLRLLLATHSIVVYARLGEDTNSPLFGDFFNGISESMGLSTIESTNMFPSTTKEDVPKQYIVSFDADLTPEEVTEKAAEAARKIGGEVIFTYNNVFKGAAIGNVDDTKLSRKRSGGLSPIGDESDESMTFEPDQTVGISSVFIQNAPRPLDRLNQNSLPLDGAYEYTYDGSGVTVFVLDTGVSETHEEFADGQVTCGFNAITSEDCTDLAGHGSHVAGSIASRTFGVAKKAQIVSVKVLGRNGGGTNAGLIAGIEYVISEKLANPDQPMVANLSVGGNKNDNVNAAARKAVEAGVVIVTAAGNDKEDACRSSPGSSSDVITVGASDIRRWMLFFKRDRRAAYSNYGGCVDIFAIGTDVESVSFQGDVSTTIKSGTSMSSPHVAGAAALYLQKSPNMTPAEVKSYMLSDASDSQMLKWFLRNSPNKLLNTKNI